MIGFVKVIAASMGSVFLVAAYASAIGGDIHPIHLQDGLIFGVLGGCLLFFSLKNILKCRNLPKI